MEATLRALGITGGTIKRTAEGWAVTFTATTATTRGLQTRTAEGTGATLLSAMYAAESSMGGAGNRVRHGE